MHSKGCTSAFLILVRDSTNLKSDKNKSLNFVKLLVSVVSRTVCGTATSERGRGVLVLLSCWQSGGYYIGEAFPI